MNRILAALKATPEGLTKTEIAGLFQRNKSSEQINRALAYLFELGLAYPVKVLTRGRPTEKWVYKPIVSIYPLKTGQFQLSYFNHLNNRRKRHRFGTRKEAEDFKYNLELKYYQQDLTGFVDKPIAKLINGRTS